MQTAGQYRQRPYGVTPAWPLFLFGWNEDQRPDVPMTSLHTRDLASAILIGLPLRVPEC
jgi:hypothetical protein